LEAVRRIDALFDIERQINGQGADQRRAVRQELSTPLVAQLQSWMREQRAELSRHNDVAQAMDYSRRERLRAVISEITPCQDAVLSA
jgi:transcriptional regulator GlxA family with amidase domain